MDITRETFCKNLRALRDKAGLKQHEAAEALGWDIKKYQRYEQGKNSPKEPTKQLLADFYRVSVADLYRPDLFTEKSQTPTQSRAELLTEIYSIAPTLHENQLKEILTKMRSFGK
jgi:transcriptional regulator with XRE-family HTH domain